MILIFVRRYNDIDHIAPVVYELARRGARFKLLCSDPGYDLARDARLRFIERKLGVKCDYVYRAYAFGWARSLLASIGCGPVGNGPFRGIKRWLQGSAIWSWLFSDGWVDRIYDLDRPTVVVQDWQSPSRALAGAVQERARARGIRLIALPHGGHILTNPLYSKTMIRENRVSPFGETWRNFDEVVVQDRWWSSVVQQGGLEVTKIRQLGNTRFCLEWEKILAEIYADEQLPASRPGRLKVLYLDHQEEYLIHKERVYEAVSLIRSLDFVDLIFKGTTTQINRSNRQVVSHPALAGLAQPSDLLSTFSLCKWADIIMGTTTSALAEASVQSKILIIPKYLHENSTVFEEVGACIVVNSHEELKRALEEIQQNPGKKFYAEAVNQRLIDELIYGGDRSRNPMAAYADLIQRVD